MRLCVYKCYDCLWSQFSGVHKEFLEQINLTKFGEFKIDMQTPIIFLYTINKKMEIGFLQMYHFNDIKIYELCLDKCGKREKPVE